MTTENKAPPVEQEPVAVVGEQADIHKMVYGQFFPARKNIKVIHPLKDLPIGTALYTHPAATISDERILEIAEAMGDVNKYSALRFARAVIKEAQGK